MSIEGVRTGVLAIQNKKVVEYYCSINYLVICTMVQGTVNGLNKKESRQNHSLNQTYCSIIIEEKVNKGN